MVVSPFGETVTSMVLDIRFPPECESASPAGRLAVGTFQRLKQSALNETDCQMQLDAPIIGIPALLSLAQWCQSRRDLIQGSESCDQSPPAPTQSLELPAKEPLAATPRRVSKKGTAKTRSDDRRTIGKRCPKKRGDA